MRINHVFVSVALFIKRAAVLFIGVLLTYLAYRWALKSTLERSNVIIGTASLYLLTVYLVLPRLHRVLAKFYVPSYFPGRSRTIDGLLADPINIAVVGSRDKFLRAMRLANWETTDKLTIKNAIRVVVSVIFKKSYPTAPMNMHYLFGKPASIRLQQEVGGNPRQRHHVRFWKTPKNWRLPGGQKVDWLGAATFDAAIGIGSLNWQFDHRIDEDSDEERDYIIKTLKKVEAVRDVDVLKHFAGSYKHHTGSGFTFYTDGNLKIIKLK